MCITLEVAEWAYQQHWNRCVLLVSAGWRSVLTVTLLFSKFKFNLMSMDYLLWSVMEWAVCRAPLEQWWGFAIDVVPPFSEKRHSVLLHMLGKSYTEKALNTPCWSTYSVYMCYDNQRCENQATIVTRQHCETMVVPLSGLHIPLFDSPWDNGVHTDNMPF